jgi:hypothetical protein
MRRRWKMTITFIIAFAVWAGWICWATARERESQVRVVNGQGEPNALVVSHPGLSHYQQEMTTEFVDGLEARGWRVTLTTPSRAAPHDLSSYDLLVLGAPVYWWTPAKPIRRYLRDLGSLHGMPTAILLTGAGSVTRARAQMEDRVRGAGGRVVSSLALTMMRPNDEDAMRAGEKNHQTAMRMARAAAMGIPKEVR